MGGKCYPLVWLFGNGILGSEMFSPPSFRIQGSSVSRHRRSSISRTTLFILNIGCGPMQCYLVKPPVDGWSHLDSHSRIANFVFGFQNQFQMPAEGSMSRTYLIESVPNKLRGLNGKVHLMSGAMVVLAIARGRMQMLASVCDHTFLVSGCKIRTLFSISLAMEW